MNGSTFLFWIYQVLVYSTAMIKLARSSACPSAQVGRSFTFRWKFQHTIEAPLKIVWSNDGIDVSHCIHGIRCSDNNKQETSTSLRDLGNGYYEFKLFVNNITSKEAGNWTLEYYSRAKEIHPEPIFRCQLKLAGSAVTVQDSQAYKNLQTMIRHKKDEMIKQTSMNMRASLITNLTASSNSATTSSTVPMISGVKTTTKHQITDNENKEHLVLIVALGVVSFVLVLVVITFFLVFRCRVKIYARFTRRNKRSSQFSTHVYESIEDINISSQTASYRYANTSLVLTNETSKECYITII